MTNLDTLGRRHGTDKTTHGYPPIYERYFDELREEPVTLLELGVGGYDNPYQGGQSLRMWFDYFPKATVIGIDDQEKRLELPPRVQIYQGSQDDGELITRIRGVHGRFDIVIDDASHVAEPTINSFRRIWPHLNPNGLYVVEDTCCSYAPECGGSPNPDAVIGGRLSTMQFFRRLADEVNYPTSWVGHSSAYPGEFRLGYQLAFVHFWPQLVILRKATHG